MQEIRKSKRVYFNSYIYTYEYIIYVIYIYNTVHIISMGEIQKPFITKQQFVIFH